MGIRATLWPASLVGILGAVIAATALQSAVGDDSSKARDNTKYLLRYKYKPGEIVRSNVLHQVILSTTISGTTQVAETTSGSVKVWKITKVEPSGRITFEHSVESVDMRQKLSGRQELTYNSKTDSKPPQVFESVAKAIGVPLTVVTIEPSGMIIKRIEHRAMPQGDSSNQMVVPLPAGSIAVGESWNLPQDITISLEDGVTKVIKTRQHYTLEKVANGLATISVATQVLTPATDSKVQSQLIQRLTKGTIQFDIDAGRVASQQLDLDEQVLGFNGSDSSLHYVGRFKEEPLDAEPKTAAKATDAAK